MMEAPARYSTIEDLAKPEAQRIGDRLSIYLDGVPVRRIVSYDIDAGELVRLVIDRRGNPLPNPAQPDEWLFQTVRGEVRVEWLDDDA